MISSHSAAEEFSTTKAFPNKDSHMTETQEQCLWKTVRTSTVKPIHNVLILFMYAHAGAWRHMLWIPGSISHCYLPSSVITVNQGGRLVHIFCTRTQKSFFFMPSSIILKFLGCLSLSVINIWLPVLELYQNKYNGPLMQSMLRNSWFVSLSLSAVSLVLLKSFLTLPELKFILC